MPRAVSVYLLPSLMPADVLPGSAVVVFDVLRATTTICYALAAGVREVLPCVDVQEARDLAASFPAGEAVLGGERGGVRIDGFDFGNSPEEYTAQRCQGKRLVFTTTNGTRAMAAARSADQVYLGSLANVSAVAAAVREAERVHLLCAGTEGEVTAEDAFAAGRVATLLMDQSGEIELNDQAVLALALAQSSSDALHVLQRSRGGRNLERLGLARDIEVAAREDVFDVAPRVLWDGSGQARIAAP